MSPTRKPRTSTPLRVAVTGVALTLLVAGMVGAAYAAVPLYRAFCQATGFNGVVRRAASTAGVRATDRTISVRFDTNVRNLPWTFTPEVTSQTVHLGRSGLAFFKVRNDGSEALTGRAVYNVSPESAGAYFLKTQCFCFSDQTIPAGREVTFPVVYFVDPKFATDASTSALSEITLSYTFYPAPTKKG